MVSLIRKFIISTCYILFTGIVSRAQNIDQAIASYADKYTPERVYLHYDKSAYSVGETVWFKAYMMSETAPADNSKTLYVDWIDDKGVLLQHSVSPILDAITTGQFDIPIEFKGKYLQVKAYTKWMLNFDSAFLYNKTIRILSKENNTPPAKTAIIPTISFFPEGGDAIAGISTKIAFKANDQWGRPVHVKGVVVNGEGKIVDSIKTSHDGMGFVLFTPEAGVVYTAKWKDEKSVEHATALPAIKQNGVALQVAVTGANRVFNIRFTKDIADAMDTLNIVGTMYQREAFRIAKPTDAPAMKGTIPTGSLPSGILTITVFDKKWNALTERITYVDNEEYLFQPEMEVQHWGLNKRARNEIKITVPDSLIANFSVSVTDVSIGSDSSNNIISHLLLSSELKGDVYNPAYYFSNRSDSVSQYLDLVMLTHGWRRFKWEQVIANKNPKPKFGRDTSYLSLSGRVYGVVPGQISPGASIIMIVKQKDKAGNFVLIPVNPDASFNDPSTILFDTAHIYYQLPKKKGLDGASLQFMTERLPSPTLTAPNTSNYSLWDTTGFSKQMALAGEMNDLAERLKMKTLEAVIVKSKTKSQVQLLDEKYTSGLFIGDGFQFDLVNDPLAAGYRDIFNYLQGKVAGLQINATSNPPSMQWRGGAPQLYLDEVAVDPDFVSSMTVNDVAYIKVFRPPFMGGFNGGNGAIAIYTRRGNDMKPEPGKGLKNNKVFGYTQIREFYSPNYSSFTQKNEDRDLRTTLYWNPNVTATPQKREVVLTFYNNDVSRSFRVIIEGMTRDGRLTHMEQVME